MNDMGESVGVPDMKPEFWGRARHVPVEQGQPIALTLSVEEAERIARAQADLVDVVSAAGGVFDLLWSGAAGGFLKHDGSDVIGLLLLCSRALKAARETDGQVLDEFDRELWGQLRRHDAGAAS